MKRLLGASHGLKVGLDDLDNCAVGVAVCCEDDAAARVERVASQVADLAAGRLAESDTGSEVEVVTEGELAGLVGKVSKGIR